MLNRLVNFRRCKTQWPKGKMAGSSSLILSWNAFTFAPTYYLFFKMSVIDAKECSVFVAKVKDGMRCRLANDTPARQKTWTWSSLGSLWCSDSFCLSPPSHLIRNTLVPTSNLVDYLSVAFSKRLTFSYTSYLLLSFSSFFLLPTDGHTPLTLIFSCLATRRRCFFFSFRGGT